MRLAFELDAERCALRDALAALAAELRARGVLGPGGAFTRAAWRALGESGALAAGSAEESGLVERVAVCEALGAAAFPGPLVETFLAIDLLGGEAAGLVAGERLASVGAPPWLPFAGEADVFIALAGERAWRASPRGTPQPVATLAGDSWSRVDLALGEPLGGADRALARARVAAAALLGAAAERAVAVAAEHARTRKQFGRAIGEYQAVAHPLASAWLELSAAQQLARVAASVGDDDAEEAGELAASAWLCARRAALRAAEVAHQALGAAGIVREGPLFHRTARIRQWASLPLDVKGAREALAAAIPPLPRAGVAP